MINTEALTIEKNLEDLLQELNSTGEEAIERSKLEKDDLQPLTDWCLQAIGQISARLPTHRAKMGALRIQLSQLAQEQSKDAPLLEGIQQLLSEYFGRREELALKLAD